MKCSVCDGGNEWMNMLFPKKITNRKTVSLSKPTKAVTLKRLTLNCLSIGWKENFKDFFQDRGVSSELREKHININISRPFVHLDNNYNSITKSILMLLLSLTNSKKKANFDSVNIFQKNCVKRCNPDSFNSHRCHGFTVVFGAILPTHPYTLCVIPYPYQAIKISLL